MTDLESVSYNLEHLFIKKIYTGLQSKTFTLAQAKQNSIDFLKIEPFSSPEDAYVKVMEFVAAHKDFVELKNFMNAYQVKKADLAKLSMMREHIRNNDINSALKVAKS